MYNIFKAPVYVGEDYPPVDTKTGDFEWLQKFPENEFNVKFISEDGDARATVFLDIDSKVNRELVWVIDVFVVDAKDREQGKGEEALLQLLHEIRDNEYKIIKKIYRNLVDKDVPFKAARAASELSSDNIIKIIEEKITGPNAHDKLDIRLGDVEPDAQGFWQKMYNRYGGYDRDGKYLGLKKSTTITTTTGKTKTVNQPLVEDDGEEPPEEEKRNYCIEKYTEIFKVIQEIYDNLFNLGNKLDTEHGRLIHGNDVKQNFPQDYTKFRRDIDEKYVNYYGSYFYKWGDLEDDKEPDRIFTFDMLAPLPNKLTEEEACYLLYILSKSKLRQDNPMYAYFNLKLDTDTQGDYLTGDYQTGILFEYYSGNLHIKDVKFNFYIGYEKDMLDFFLRINLDIGYHLDKILFMARSAVGEYPDGEDYFERFY